MTLYNISLLKISSRSHDLKESKTTESGFILSAQDYDMDKYLTSEEKDKIIETLSNQLRRGDIVHIDEAGSYGNQGKLIYDGKLLTSLYYGVDSYGSVPPSFHIGDEFLANHWIDSIDHNALIWINHEKYRDQLMENMEDDHTWFSTPLGKFTIRFVPVGHKNNQAAQFIFALYLGGDQPVTFHATPNGGEIEGNPYTLYYEYHVHDPLYDGDIEPDN